MKDEMFNELLQSIKQGGKILKGKRKPSREYVFDLKILHTTIGYKL
jgi:preprotein translocase subunit Sss1